MPSANQIADPRYFAGAKKLRLAAVFFWRGVSSNLFNPPFDFIARYHKFSSASGTAQFKVHSCPDNVHSLTAAWVRFFHQQDISRPDIHICHHPLSNHKYIILYPISFRMAISPENIFLSLYKYSKTEGGNPVKFHKRRFYFSIFSHLKHNCRAAPGHSPA